uniref:Apple domain-containing protein n=1 Tax=Rhabditophanes sp. KR3021 TaxID=114890 RepID=A0AC35TN59_9BILA
MTVQVPNIKRFLSVLVTLSFVPVTVISDAPARKGEDVNLDSSGHLFNNPARDIYNNEMIDQNRLLQQAPMFRHDDALTSRQDVAKVFITAPPSTPFDRTTIAKKNTNLRSRMSSRLSTHLVKIQTEPSKKVTIQPFHVFDKKYQVKLSQKTTATYNQNVRANPNDQDSLSTNIIPSIIRNFSEPNPTTTTSLPKTEFPSFDTSLSVFNEASIGSSQNSDNDITQYEDDNIQNVVTSPKHKERQVNKAFGDDLYGSIKKGKFLDDSKSTTDIKTTDFPFEVSSELEDILDLGENKGAKDVTLVKDISSIKEHDGDGLIGNNRKEMGEDDVDSVDERNNEMVKGKLTFPTLTPSTILIKSTGSPEAVQLMKLAVPTSSSRKLIELGGKESFNGVALPVLQKDRKQHLSLITRTNIQGLHEQSIEDFSEDRNEIIKKGLVDPNYGDRSPKSYLKPMRIESTGFQPKQNEDNNWRRKESVNYYRVKWNERNLKEKTYPYTNNYGKEEDGDLIDFANDKLTFDRQLAAPLMVGTASKGVDSVNGLVSMSEMKDIHVHPIKINRIPAVFEIPKPIKLPTASVIPSDSREYEGKIQTLRKKLALRRKEKVDELKYYPNDALKLLIPQRDVPNKAIRENESAKDLIGFEVASKVELTKHTLHSIKSRVVQRCFEHSPGKLIKDLRPSERRINLAEIECLMFCGSRNDCGVISYSIKLKMCDMYDKKMLGKKSVEDLSISFDGMDLFKPKQNMTNIMECINRAQQIRRKMEVNALGDGVEFTNKYDKRRQYQKPKLLVYDPRSVVENNIVSNANPAVAYVPPSLRKLLASTTYKDKDVSEMAELSDIDDLTDDFKVPLPGSSNEFSTVLNKSDVQDEFSCGSNEVYSFILSEGFQTSARDGKMFYQNCDLASCKESCLKNVVLKGHRFECDSFAHDATNQDCFIYDLKSNFAGKFTDNSLKKNSLKKSATLNYYEKICINDKLAVDCRKNESYLKKLPQHILLGFASLSKKSKSMEGCANLCYSRSKTEDICDSIMFFNDDDDNNCFLNMKSPEKERESYLLPEPENSVDYVSISDCLKELD